MSYSTTAAVKEGEHCVSCNVIFGPFSYTLDAGCPAAVLPGGSHRQGLPAAASGLAHLAGSVERAVPFQPADHLL